MLLCTMTVPFHIPVERLDPPAAAAQACPTMQRILLVYSQVSLP